MSWARLLVQLETRFVSLGYLVFPKANIAIEQTEDKIVIVKVCLMITKA